MKPLAVVKTGRAGDVLGILPLLHHLNTQGTRPSLVVSREYAHAASYISYADVDVVDTPFEDCLRVVRKARERYHTVLDASVYGWSLAYGRVAQHFTSEAYHRAGREYGRMYDEGKFRQLIFDKPILMTSLVQSSPMVVMCFTGNSSPLPRADEWKSFLAEGLNRRGIGVCDISHIRMPSVTDLLPTLNAASAVVSLDTSILHLMAASKTPYVALRNDLFGGDRWYAAPAHGASMAVWYSEAWDKRHAVLEKLVLLSQ